MRQNNGYNFVYFCVHFSKLPLQIVTNYIKNGSYLKITWQDREKDNSIKRLVLRDKVENHFSEKSKNLKNLLNGAFKMIPVLILHFLIGEVNIWSERN